MLMARPLQVFLLPSLSLAARKTNPAPKGKETLIPQVLPATSGKSEEAGTQVLMAKLWQAPLALGLQVVS
jgi:hypothetical protein